MKRIFFGLVLLFLFFSGHNSQAKDEFFYCFGPTNATVYTEVTTEKSNSLNRCENEFQKVNFEITEKIYDKLNQINNERQSIRYTMSRKGEFNNSFFGNDGLEKKMKFDEQTDQILREIVENSKADIEVHNRNRAKIIKQEDENKKKAEAEFKLKRAVELEKNFGSMCRKYSKGSTEYNNCLVDQEKIVKETEAKKLALRQDQEKKKAELERQTKLEEERANKLLVSMKPEERRAYICEKTYGFKKGSDRFADCVFKIMTTDAELEKLDKQRRIAEAQLKAEKEKAPAPTYDPAIGRAAEKTVEIEAARLRREQEEENARLMFALSKGLGTPGGFNSKVQGTVDSLNPNQNRRTKRVCNSLSTASGYQTVCKDVPY